MNEPITDYRVIRSDRSSVSAEIGADGCITVRAPIFLTDAEIAAFVEKNREKLERGREKMKKALEARKNAPKLSQEELRELKRQAQRTIPTRVAHFASLMDVGYSKISFRAMKSRWGSCSSEGGLTFNTLLMLTPPEVIDSVIVHELCHRREMNHSKAFYRLLYTYCPDYDESRAWLKESGAAIIIRLG